MLDLIWLMILHGTNGFYLEMLQKGGGNSNDDLRRYAIPYSHHYFTEITKVSTRCLKTENLPCSTDDDNTLSTHGHINGLLNNMKQRIRDTSLIQTVCSLWKGYCYHQMAKVFGTQQSDHLGFNRSDRLGVYQNRIRVTYRAIALLSIQRSSVGSPSSDAAQSICGVNVMRGGRWHRKWMFPYMHFLLVGNTHVCSHECWCIWCEKRVGRFWRGLSHSCLLYIVVGGLIVNIRLGYLHSIFSGITWKAFEESMTGLVSHTRTHSVIHFLYSSGFTEILSQIQGASAVLLHTHFSQVIFWAYQRQRSGGKHRWGHFCIISKLL